MGNDVMFFWFSLFVFVVDDVVRKKVYKLLFYKYFLYYIF